MTQRVLVDTNVYLRLTSPKHPHYAAARRAMQWIFERGDPICFTLQTAAELWNDCTRPADANGLGYSTEQAEHLLAVVEAAGTLLPGTDEVYSIWRRLLRDYQVKGVRVHDARLVASMVVHSVPTIVTFNVSDFRRYRAIEAISPETL